MRHKTKRLHRLTFGLHLSEFCLHPWHGMFTQHGLHVCACGSFRLLSYNCLSVGVLRVCVAFPCQCGDGGYMALEWRSGVCGQMTAKNREIGGGVTGGVTKWGYIFEKVGLQIQGLAIQVQILQIDILGL